MIAGKKAFVLLLFLMAVGCTDGTTSTKSDTGLQPPKKINCATIDLGSMTGEERQFCNGGGF